MSLLDPTNPAEAFITPFTDTYPFTANDPTNLVGRGLVASGGIGPVPFADTAAAAALFPLAFNPSLSDGSLSGGFDPIAVDNQVSQILSPLVGFDPVTSPVNFGTQALGILGDGSTGFGPSPLDTTFNQGIDSVFGGLGLIGITPDSLGLV